MAGIGGVVEAVVEKGIPERLEAMFTSGDIPMIRHRVQARATTACQAPAPF
jgi:hypothetical protein